MFEDEDVILPDDFEMSTEVEAVEDTTPTEQTEVESIETQEQSQELVETEQPDNQFLDIKYNKELQWLSRDEARELAQMGKNYPKLQEKLQALESDPRLDFVEGLARDNGMTVQEYLSAVQEQQEQARLNELIQQNIPEEYAREMLENRKFRQELEAEKQAKQQEEQQNAQYNEFFEYFREANGRDFVPNQDEIPPNVWEATQSGVPLKFAYMMHENSQLRNQIQTFKQNESNAKKAPITPVTAHGGVATESEDDFLSGFNSI